MPQQYAREPDYLVTMADGTVKQLNPFSGTEVWTVPGRGHRPLGIASATPEPLDPSQHGRYCAFCERRYHETPPEKARMIHHGMGGWETLYKLSADQLDHTVAEFRRVPNLFEILSFEYWHANYSYTLPARVAELKDAYLSSPAGMDHVLAIVDRRLEASGKSKEQISKISREEKLAVASNFFGGGHDVIIARRHYVDGATNSTQLASSGTLSAEEHAQFVAFTIEAMQGLYNQNRYARYVTVFQNWLKPAGASFDHLHKQLVAIDERGAQHEHTIRRLRDNPNFFNEAAVNFASYKNLVIAENDHAVAFAGFGHRYPSIEVYSKSEHSDPWEQSAEEVRAMSDLLHAVHAATGTDVPSNEEWHYRPIDVDLAMPWRVVLKWRISTVAGFEGATKIYLNTLSPEMVRDRVVTRLFALRAEGRIAPDCKIAFEAPCRPNSLRYNKRS